MSQIGEEDEKVTNIRPEESHPKIKHDGSVSSHSRKSSEVSEDKQNHQADQSTEQNTHINHTEQTNQADQPSRTQTEQFTHLQPTVDLAHLGNTYQIGPLEPEVKEQLPTGFYQSQYNSQQNNEADGGLHHQEEEHKAPESQIVHVLVDQTKVKVVQDANEKIQEPEIRHEEAQATRNQQAVQQHSPPVAEQPQQHEIVVEVPPPQNTHPYQEQHLIQHQEPQSIHAAHIDVPQTDLMPVPLQSDEVEQKRLSEYEQHGVIPEDQKAVPEDQKVTLSLAEQDQKAVEQPINEAVNATPDPNTTLEQPRSSNKTKDTQLPGRIPEAEEEVKLLRDQTEEPIKKSYVNMKDPKKKPSKEGSHSEAEACKCSTM